MSPVIETHFLAMLLMLGPEAQWDGEPSVTYFDAVVKWWEDHVGFAGTHWYAHWFIKWSNAGGQSCEPVDEIYEAQLS